MFNVGPMEVLIILAVALVVLGPERLPKTARQVGKAVSEFRRMTAGARRDLEEALNTDEVREGLAEVRGSVREVRKVVADLKGDVNAALSPATLVGAVAGPTFGGSAVDGSVVGLAPPPQAPAPNAAFAWPPAPDGHPEPPTGALRPTPVVGVPPPVQPIGPSEI